MQKSTYPDGILIDTTVLAYTELSKAAEILRGRIDWTSRGIFSGGAITVGAVDDTRIDIAGFTGFAPNGEFVECVGNLASIQLDDSTLAAINYVVAFYTESLTRSQPHETDGQTYATRAVGSYRVRVYEESAFNALAATNNNLADDARDRALLLGKVTGNGAGVTLTASEITSPTVYNNILYADPRMPLTIPGTTISGVSPGMSTGAGTLDYTWGAGPVYGLQWTSFAGGAGAVVNPTIDGSIQVADGLGEYLTIEIVISQLSTSTPISETITIINMYEQDIPRQSGDDDLHRNMQGTGTPTPTNPHGMSLDDLSGSDFGLLEEHQDVMHSNGIWNGSSPAIFSGSITFPVGGDLFSIVSPALSDLYYINGKKLNTLTPTSFQFIPTVIPSSAAGCHMYEVGVDDNETAYVNLKMSFPAPRTVTGCWITDASDEYPVGGGSANLALTVTNPAGVDLYAFSWDAGEVVNVDATQSPRMLRLFAANAIDWVDIWVNSTAGHANPDFNPPAVGVYSDPITIFASADATQNMPIASFPGAWDATAAPARFAIGFPTFGVTRNFVDKRIWGTLAKENLSDSTLQELVYAPLDELHYSGILYSRSALHDNFEIYGVAGLNVGVRGGAYYLRGERKEYAGTAAKALVDNTVNLLFVNTEGTLDLLDVTADFAGSVQNALEHLLGRSQLVDADHDSQFPERGCPLFEFTTAAGAVTRTRNLARNVNNAVEPWSVAAFTGQSQPRSAFDSLRTAFYYAAIQPIVCEITLTGPSLIEEVITQPSGTVVRGGANSAGVGISHVDAAGVWVLSENCRVEDATITMTANASAAIRLNNNCRVSRCRYTTSATTQDIFCTSAVALLDVRVEDCDVDTRLSAVRMSHTGSQNTYVRGNIVTQTFANASGFNYGLIDLAGTRLYIEDNTLTTNNGTDYVFAIRLGAVSNEVWIRDNQIAIGDGDAVVSEVGILVDDPSCTNVHISGNHIQMLAGVPTEISIGVSLPYGGSHIAIHDNKFNEIGVGVLIQDNFYDVEVYSNEFLAGWHAGVKVDTLTYPTGNEVYGLRIEDNTMTAFTRGLAGGTGWGLFLRGVHLDFSTLLTADSTVHSVSVSNNTMTEFVNTNGGIRCIDIFLDSNINTSQRNFKIDDNIISGLTPDSSARGIFLTGTNVTENMYPISTSSIDGNKVYIYYDTAVGGIRVAGIDIEHALSESTVDDNSVEITGANATSNGYGICVNEHTRASRSWGITVNGNSVKAPRAGIYMNAINSTVNGNSILSNGEGIFLATHLSAAASEVHLECDGNVIQCYSYNDNPFVAVGGGNGTHCICTANDMLDFSITNNRCRVDGIPGVLADTACIKIRDCTGFHIAGNSTKIDAADVAGTAGDGGFKAYHIYTRCGLSTNFDCLGDISENYIDNWVGLATDSVCYGLYIEPITGYLHSNGDRTRISCTGNTIMSSSWIFRSAPGFFNADATAGNAPATTIARPFEIYVADFSADQASPPYNIASRVFFGGNSIMCPDEYEAEPKTYIFNLHGAVPFHQGPSMSNSSNFVESATNMPAGSSYW